MAYKADILFGRITKINSYDGSVTVRLEKSFIENIPEMGSVFLEIDGKPVPFFISEIDYPGAETIKIALEDYNNSEKIKHLRGSRVFLTSSEKIEGLTAAIHSIEGYDIFSKEKILIGMVKEVIQNPGQSVMVVVSPSKEEILIPLHEDLIIKADRKRKMIIMHIADGLTDINKTFFPFQE